MWDVKTLRVNRVEAIPGADRLEVCYINDWPVVTQKGQFQEGQLCCYIPYDSILPDALIEQLELVGKLSGSKKNRVKPVKLRGQLSIGLLMKAPEGVAEGTSLAEQLGITKYEEEIPPQLAGKCKPRPPFFMKYDVENIRSNQYAFKHNEVVWMLEKVHGGNQSCALIEDKFYVCSRSMCLEEGDNSYWKAAKRRNIENILREYVKENNTQFIYIVGELLPCQDLRYNLDATNPDIYVFDIRDENGWWDFERVQRFCEVNGLNTVPVLYHGPYSKEILAQCTNGNTMINNAHIREGCVVRTDKEETDRWGRRMYKSVSEAYFLRKGKTTELH